MNKLTSFLCFFLVLSRIIVGQDLVDNVQKTALEIFYNSTDGQDWQQKDNWMNGDPCLHLWYGVDCKNSEVIELSLGFNSLDGTLPTEMGNLINLSYLIY
mmetsp:Transcript_30299/g.47014  ORF Transcript_30299/g.47014 Transcript_30299/m.47014 type:complete len:100 (-) Transcript_30299:150-449(-)